MEKVAIITAASRGMGKAIAKRLALNGYKTSLMARSGEVEKVAGEIGGMAFIGSVESDKDIRKFVNLVFDKYGRIDVVVNNTGHATKGALLDIAEEDWKAGYELLLLNVIRMSKYVTPIMKKQGGGSIINISTFAALEPSLDFPVSSVVRAGLAAFVKLYSSRYAEAGIRMNNILPGFVDSFPVKDETVRRIPSGRAGKVDEIAGVVSFLASDEASYINGENIRIDGGLSRSL